MSLAVACVSLSLLVMIQASNAYCASSVMVEQIGQIKCITVDSAEAALEYLANTSQSAADFIALPANSVPHNLAHETLFASFNRFRDQMFILRDNVQTEDERVVITAIETAIYNSFWSTMGGLLAAEARRDDATGRVTSNWAVYGGYVSLKRARERHPVEYPPDDIIAKLNPERAVFDVELLGRVARSRQKRALRKHPTDSVNKNAKAYALSGITHCAHCERMAQQNNNPRLRSLLWGHRGIYYRHKPSGACGCQRQSVQRDLYEADFFRLVKLLEVKPERLSG